MYTTKEYIPIVKLNQICTVDKENIHVTNGLPTGDYQYINHHTFFMRVKPIASSSLPAKYFESIVKDAPIEDVLPGLKGPKSVLTLRTSTLVLVLEKEQRNKAVAIFSGDISTADPGVLKETFKDCFLVDTNKMPELFNTEGFAQCQEKFFGNDFVVSRNLCLLGKDFPFCESSTSQPDAVVYHKKKFVTQETVHCASLMDHTYEHNYKLIVSASEDKNKGINGESQCIAGQFQLASKLGLKAVADKKFFTKAVVYGYLRQVQEEIVRPYRLEEDFVTRECFVLRSDSCITPDQYISTIKALFENL